MKKREILISDIPAPGEPLKPKIHETNQRLIAEELEERKQRAAAKLTGKQTRQLKRRYRVLHRILNKYNYNKLILLRHEYYETCTRISGELKKATGKAKKVLRAELIESVTMGKKLNAAIGKLKHWADEFEVIVQRFKAHDEFIAWEKKDLEDKKAFRREADVWAAQLKSVFRQSPRLHHAGTDRNGKPFVKIPKIDQIIFKEDRVLFHIQTTTQSPLERLLGRYHSALPYSVDIKDLTSDETKQNLSAGCRRPVEIEYSNGGTNMFYAMSRLDALDGLPSKMPYSKVLDWYPIHDHNKTPWIAGVTKDRKAEFYNFEDLPHILIAGSTQSGKSNHVNQMIATFVTMNSPAELRLMLVDLKGGIEFTHWTGIKHALRPMVKRADDVLEALQYIRSIMEKRLAMFEAMKAKNLASYNGKAAKKLPRIITIVDEMATLLGLGELTTSLHNELRVLSSQGRAVGIHLVLCTQHSSVDVLPGWVKTNMSLRVSGKMPSATASQVILDSITAATLPNIPGRLVFSVGRYEIIAQSPYISDDEIARAVKLSRFFPDPDDTDMETPKPKFGIEDVISYALANLQGKLSAYSMNKALGNEVATERQLKRLIAEILEKGSIEHEGVTYKIRKVGKAYFLEAIGQLDPPTDDEDTAEYRLINGLVENSQ